ILHEVSGRSEEKSSLPESHTSRAAMLDGNVGPGQNILSLLSNAQKTYEQEHGASYEQVDPRPIKHPSGDASGMSQISLDDLFRTVNQHSAKAGMVDTGTDTVKNPVYARSISVTEVEAQAVVKQPDTRHPILKLISSKTVEEIEKQHLEEHKRLKAGGAAPTIGNFSAASHSSRQPHAANDPGQDLMQLLRQGRAKQPVVKSVGSEGDSGDKVTGKHAVVKKLITTHDPQFGTNRGFIPVTLPSNAHSVDEIENSLVYPAMPDAPLAEDLISGRKKDTSAIFPTILKPSDLDPSLAKPKS
ncbi:mRNA-decapping enzyme 1A, partial [Biomphalaria glabrata]